LGKPNAIGLFDSGVGGLTVAEEIFRILPGEPIIYFGDTANVPYGGRSAEELISFGDRIVRFLIEQGAKYIVFACNTSSAVSLETLRRRHPVPMMGLIHPGARAAVQATRRGRIGVLATEATIRSGAYTRAIQALAPHAEVFGMPAPKLVPLVEAGELDSPRTEAALREYLEPLARLGIDCLLLGCTHYPFLSEPIRRLLEPGTVIVDPAAAVAAEVRADMARRGLLGPQRGSPQHRYYVSGDVVSFARTAALFTRRGPLAVDRLCLTG